MRPMPTGRIRSTSVLLNGTIWSCRRQVVRAIWPGTTSTSTDGPRNSPKGAWGLLRVYDKEQPDLKKLPAGFSAKGEIPKALPVCPADAPVKNFNVVAHGLSCDDV